MSRVSTLAIPLGWALSAAALLTGCAESLGDDALGDDALGAEVGGPMAGIAREGSVPLGKDLGGLGGLGGVDGGGVGALVALLPEAVVPVAGQEGGRGTATVALVPERRELCFEIEVEGLGEVVGAHLHEAPVGVTGEVVLALTAPSTGDATAAGCVNAPGSQLDRITREPGRFYVDVHSSARPEGAVRGQLRHGDGAPG